MRYFEEFGNQQSHFHSLMIISSKASQMAVSQMENVKGHNGKKHSLENSEVYLFNINALEFKGIPVHNYEYFSEYKKV